MRHNLGKELKGEYLNYYRTYDNERLEELDLRKSSDNEYGHINFKFDRSNSVLTIAGDFGFAIFCWYSSQNTLFDIAKYSKSLGYFISKCQCASRPIKLYPAEAVRHDLLAFLSEAETEARDNGKKHIYKNGNYWNNKQECLEVLESCFDEKLGFNPSLSHHSYMDYYDLNKDLNDLSSSWQEDFDDLGCRNNETLEVYARALQLGTKWVKRKLAKAQNHKAE